MPRSIITSARHAIVCLFVAGLAACGGGNDGDTSAVSKLASDGALDFVKQIPPVDASTIPVHALAASGSVSADALMDWVQYKFPTLLTNPTPSIPFDFQGTHYTVRGYFYSGGARYVGITDAGGIYALGDFTNNNLQSFGVIADYASQVLADACKVYPSRCTGGSDPVGPLNACTAPASVTLATGNRFTATYLLSGTATGQYTITSVVDGPDTFEGKSAVRSTSTQEGTTSVSGFNLASSSTIKSYQVAQPAGGFVSSLGTDATTVASGRTTSLHVVFNPADINSEFSLQIGQSITKSLSTSTTVAGISTISSTSSSTYTYEGNETITVQGKSYNTCRYREDSSTGTSTTVTKNWVIMGKGVPARTQTTTTSPSAGTQTSSTELVSGSINGAAL
jgi:hypothetical protein